jgi:hypothetical protein
MKTHRGIWETVTQGEFFDPATEKFIVDSVCTALDGAIMTMR